MAPMYNNSFKPRGTKRQLPLISDYSMEELGLTPKNKKTKIEKPKFQIYEDETATPPSIIDTPQSPSPTVSVDDDEFAGIMHNVHQFVNDYIKMATFTYSRDIVRWATPLAAKIDKHSPDTKSLFQSRLETWRADTQWTYHQKRGRKSGPGAWDNSSDWFELSDAEKLRDLLGEMFASHSEIVEREEKEGVAPGDRMDPVIERGIDPGKNILKIGGYWKGKGSGLALPMILEKPNGDGDGDGKGAEYWEKFGEVWSDIVENHVEKDLDGIGCRQRESKDGGWGMPRWVERVCRAMKSDEGMAWNWKYALEPRWGVLDNRPWLQDSWTAWDGSRTNVNSELSWDSPERQRLIMISGNEDEW